MARRNDVVVFRLAFSLQNRAKTAKILTELCRHTVACTSKNKRYCDLDYYSLLWCPCLTTDYLLTLIQPDPLARRRVLIGICSETAVNLEKEIIWDSLGDEGCFPCQLRVLAVRCAVFCDAVLLSRMAQKNFRCNTPLLFF